MTQATCNKISSFGTARAFMKEGACSAATINVLNRAFGHPMELEEHATIPFAGGIVQQGYQCGVLWGATLSAGAQAYRLFGPGPRAEAAAMHAARKLVETFRASEKEINCLELTETDWNNKWQMTRYLLKGGAVSCMGRVIRFAQKAFDVINDALSEVPEEVSSGPASCAAELARKVGASEMHAVMAAGLAGGIGMSGGACGALGAAIWITGMNNPEENVFKKNDDSQVGETIDRFLKSTDHEFECWEICGQSFEGVGDHVEHLRCGGCSKVMEALSATDRDSSYPLAKTA